MSTSNAFWDLAMGWEDLEAQSLHDLAEKAFGASVASAEHTCSVCNGECSSHLLPQAEQASRSALRDWLEGRDNSAAKAASTLWEQVEAEGNSICLLCYGRKLATRG